MMLLSACGALKVVCDGCKASVTTETLLYPDFVARITAKRWQTRRYPDRKWEHFCPRCAKALDPPDDPSVTAVPPAASTA